MLQVTGLHLGYGFVEFRGEEDAEYAIKVMNMIKVYGKPIKVNKASQDKRIVDIGANIFVGNLDRDVDEKLLYDTFSAFGGITQTPKIMRDPDTGHSKGYGFISFDSFEASDLAIECMNGQFLANRPIVVQYAFKKDSQGERHGSQAERLIAASNPVRLRPHTTFAAPITGVPGAQQQVLTAPAPPAAPQTYGHMAPPPPAVSAGYGQMPPPPPPQMQHGMMPPPPPPGAAYGMPPGMPPPPHGYGAPPPGYGQMPPPPPPQQYQQPPPPQY